MFTHHAGVHVVSASVCLHKPFGIVYKHSDLSSLRGLEKGVQAHRCTALRSWYRHCLAGNNLQHARLKGPGHQWLVHPAAFPPKPGLHRLLGWGCTSTPPPPRLSVCKRVTRQCMRNLPPMHAQTALSVFHHDIPNTFTRSVYAFIHYGTRY
jgi:hypothetical protein